jgi:hypothetical protein
LELEASWRPKTKLKIEPCILGYPYAVDPFILDTNVSTFAIGAVLSQVQNGKERVLNYGSSVLTPAQCKYCTTRRELVALVTFCRQYRHYLFGRKFLVRTDQNSLTWLLRFRHIEGQLACWLEELSQFDMVVVHRPGTKNMVMPKCCPEFLTQLLFVIAIELVALQKIYRVVDVRFAGEHWHRFKEDVDDVVPLAMKLAMVRQLRWYVDTQLQ